MVQQEFSLKRNAVRIIRQEKFRFGLVGIINTSIDFAVFLVLVALFNVPKVGANIISTSCALVVSYSLNKKSVFKSTDPSNIIQVVLFVITTLFGLWVLQNSIIVIVVSWLSMLDSTAALVIAKLVATVASLVWNYVWYSKVIFKKADHEKNQ